MSQFVNADVQRAIEVKIRQTTDTDRAAQAGDCELRISPGRLLNHQRQTGVIQSHTKLIRLIEVDTQKRVEIAGRGFDGGQITSRLFLNQKFTRR